MHANLLNTYIGTVLAQVLVLPHYLVKFKAAPLLKGNSVGTHASLMNFCIGMESVEVLVIFLFGLRLKGLISQDNSAGFLVSLLNPFTGMELASQNAIIRFRQKYSLAAIFVISHANQTIIYGRMGLVFRLVQLALGKMTNIVSVLPVWTLFVLSVIYPLALHVKFVKREVFLTRRMYAKIAKLSALNTLNKMTKHMNINTSFDYGLRLAILMKQL